ncbi:hypothetical protein [Streptomyces sp. NPDC017435]|uniref:hypothetical protein n=1 Tax=Streptomyces sp. NPDC017435 TaxID=3364995 RepID=UPI00379D2A87
MRPPHSSSSSNNAPAPASPTDKLKLFPATLANLHGTKATTYEWVSAQHRAWVKGLPDFLVPTVIVEDGKRVTTMLPFDKNKIYPYAYRHTAARRTMVILLDYLDRLTLVLRFWRRR